MDAIAGGICMTEPAGEEELVSRARTGDRGAFEALYLAHRDALAVRLERKLGRRVSEESSLEDLLQETFLRALGLMDRFEWRGEGSVLRWLVAIGEHLILNAAQRAARGPLKLEVGPAGEPRDPGVSPSRAMRREERLRRLEKALAGLSPAEREAILAMRIDGLSLEEAARRLGKSPEAIKKAVTRALERLRRKLDDTQSYHLPRRPIELPGMPEKGDPS
jgi:RNA polymerase sigma-70 factor (ECF subfamily)